LGSAFTPAVAAPQYMAVILDPQQQFGAPEIVWVTAHTGGANTATVVRAQEGSTLRAHNTGEFWVAGPTPQDYFPWNWTSYTPTWASVSGGASVGNGALVGNYALFGATCFLNISLVFGSTTSGGNGGWSFTLPPGVTGIAIAQNLVCECQTTGSGSIVWAGFANIATGSQSTIAPFISQSINTVTMGQVQNTDSSGNTGHGIPNTGNNYPFGNGANLLITGVFQTA
jgi:hypothetical protein